jgi:hypothetical protein
MATKLRTANSLSQVADAVTRFLRSDAPSSRRLVRDVIEPLSEIGEVTIIGGLVRDLAFYGLDERPISDIDLVVKGSPSMVALFAERSGAVPNRFGGFGLTTPAFKADFWALSSTWARKEGHISMTRPEHLLKCTFFDWDAIIYSTRTGKVTARKGYIDQLHRRVLDLNLEPNPSVLGNLARALRRVMMWDVRVGPKLRNFIYTNIFAHEWKEIVSAEAGAFHTRYLARFSSADEFVTEILSNPTFAGVGRDDHRQQALPFVRSQAHSYYVKPLPDRISPTSLPTPVARRIYSKTPDLFGE